MEIPAASIAVKYKYGNEQARLRGIGKVRRCGDVRIRAVITTRPGKISYCALRIYFLMI